MIIPYYQMNSLILNSYQCIYPDIYRLKPRITFENYVKSQLHCNIVTALFNRSILRYSGALKFIRGNDKHLKDYEIVLKWYYEDLANIILKGMKNISEDFSILDSDIPRIETLNCKKINIAKVQRDLVAILDKNELIDCGEFRYLDILKTLPLDSLESIKPSLIFSEGLAMKFVAGQEINYYLEVSK